MKKSDIAFEYASLPVFQTYTKQIENFNCSKEGHHEGLNQRLRQSLMQDVTTLIFFDCLNENHIIGYCSYCCSSLKYEGEVCPAVEIINFAVDQKYQDRYFDSYETDEPRMPCSAFILRYSVSHIEEISQQHMRARYLFLHSDQREKTVHFYKQNLFHPCPRDFNPFGRWSEFTMIHEIIPPYDAE